MALRIIYLITLFCLCLNSYGQDIPGFTQHFSNPYLINPAYAGVEGRTNIFLTHRRQWIGIDNSPVTSNFSLHAPVVLGLNAGLNIHHDVAGIFTRSKLLLSLGYSIDLGWNHFLSFGASAGVRLNSVILDEGVNLSDPALVGVLENNKSLAGNAGLVYHIQNFNLGFTLPTLFAVETYGKEDFDTGELSVLTNYVITADYLLYFAAGELAFQPYVLYRSYDGFEPQFEAGGLIHVKHLLWGGGAYRQDFGISAMIGAKLNNTLSIGYSYEIPGTKLNGVNTTSHEIQLSFGFGKRNNRSEKYSTFLASSPVTKPVKKKEKIEEEEEEDPFAEFDEFAEFNEEEQEDPFAEFDDNQVTTNQNITTNSTNQEQEDPFAEFDDNPVTRSQEQITNNSTNQEQEDPFVEFGNNQVTTNSNIAVDDRVKDSFGPSSDEELISEKRQARYEKKVDYTKDVGETELQDKTVDGIVQFNQVQETQEVEYFNDGEYDIPEMLNDTGEGVIVTSKGFHPNELAAGHYVIVARFKDQNQANTYKDDLIQQGYSAADYGYSSEKEVFYITLYKGSSSVEAHYERDKHRRTEKFKTALYLLVR